MIELRPKKPIAKSWLVYVVAVIYCVIFVCGVCTIVNLVKRSFNTCLIFLGICLGLILLCFVLSRVLAWYTIGKIYKSNKLVVYDCYSIGDCLGRNKAEYKIKGVNKVKPRGRDLIVFGDITAKEVMGKTNKVKKLVIIDGNTEELINFMNKEFSL